MSLFTYTTPTLTLTFPKEIDLTEGSNHVLTFANPSNETVILEKTDLTISEHTCEVFLTQEESALMPRGNIAIQLNWLFNDGSIVRRVASIKKNITFDSNLKKEKME